MKLLIFFITLLLGVSLNLMAKDTPQTGSQPSSSTEATAGTNICKDCPDANSPKGKLTDNKGKAELCKAPVGGLTAEESKQFHKEECPVEHETASSGTGSKGNK